MLNRVMGVSLLFLTVCSAASAQPTLSPQQEEVIQWVIRSLVDDQKRDWSDWTTPADERVVLLSDETMPFPIFADTMADFSLKFAMETLEEDWRGLDLQVRNIFPISLADWTPAPPIQFRDCGGQDEPLPKVIVVPSRALERSFKGERLDDSAALAIRMSTPVFSPDGRASVVYAEAIGSHVDNSLRELISLTRKSYRPEEWDAMIDVDRLFPPAKPAANEREISNADVAVVTAALQWLVSKQGSFDLVASTDVAPDPTVCRRLLRESNSGCEPSEETLAQFSRRNSDLLTVDTSRFAVGGVRNLADGDDRVWSRPSVLFSLPAYDGSDTALVALTYRDVSQDGEVVRTAQYVMVLRRVSARWSVVCSAVQHGVIVS